MGVIEGSIPRFSWSGISFMKSNQSYFKPFSFYSPWNYFLDLPIMCRKSINVHKINTKAHMRVIEESIPRFSWSGISFMKSNQSYFKPFSFYSPWNYFLDLPIMCRKYMNVHKINTKALMRVIEESIPRFSWSGVSFIKLIHSYFKPF